MALPFEQVVKQLGDSGIIAPGQLENFVPPKAHPKNIEELVNELVKQNHLTNFQAQHIKAGKSKSLILGGYTILDRIGAGGMGQVFKALHRRMDRTVAIKMLPPAMTKDAAAVARFEREVRAAAKLEHPNIVTAYDADQANGVHFLVMQYVEGQDLSVLVKKDGAFSVARSVNYVLQAARGLEFAHGEGVVHRDIKPANLLLDKKGVVKILDMGLARIDGGGGAGALAELTGTGAVMGTVDYMAPEQGMSTKHADARADIYSLGCTLHYLLIGKPVYRGETVTAKLVAHHNDPIPNLCQLRDEVSELVQSVFSKMVAKKVQDRYQTMNEVIAELEQCNSGQSTLPGFQQSVNTSLDNSAFDNSAFTFLKEIPAQTVHRTTQKSTKAIGDSRSKNKLPLLIGAGVAAAIVLLLGLWVVFLDSDGKPNSPRQKPVQVANVRTEDAGSATSRPAGTPANATSGRSSRVGTWQPGPVAGALPGLTPTPAKLPGIGNWNIETVGARGGERLALSPDRKRLAVAGVQKDSWVRVYDAETGKLLKLLPAADIMPEVVAWSADGKRLSAIGSNRITVWDEDGRRAAGFKEHPGGPRNNANVAIWSPDGAALAVGSSEGSVRLWNTDGSCGPIMRGHSGDVVALAWSPDSRQIISGGRDKTVRIWKADGTAGRVLKGHASLVSGVAWCNQSPTGVSADDVIASSDYYDQKIRIWRPDGAAVRTIDVKGAELSPPVWNRARKQLAVGNIDGEIMLFSLDGQPGPKVQVHRRAIRSLDWVADGSLISAGSDMVIRTDIDASTSRVLVTNTATVSSIQQHPTEPMLVSTSFDGTAKIWLENGDLCAAWETGWVGGSHARWHPNGQMLATYRHDTALRMWDRDGRSVETPSGKFGDVAHMDWSSDGQQLVVARSSKPIAAVMKFDGTIGPELQGHSDRIAEVAWNQRTNQIATASHDATVRLWTSDGKPGPILAGHTSAVTSVAWSPDGRMLASTGDDGTLRLWSADGKLIRLMGGSNRMRGVSWSSDGQFVAAAGYNTGLVHVWDMNGDTGPELRGHQGGVHDTTWNQNGSLVQSAAEDGTIRTWNFRTGQCVSIELPLSNGQAAVLSAAGEMLLATSGAEEQLVYAVEKADQSGIVDVLTPAEFRQRVGNHASPPLVQRQGSRAWDTPQFQAWMKTVASMTAAKQVEAVAKKLQELNPGFDGKVTPNFEGRVVTELKFLTHKTTDISPVRALVGLKYLECGDSPQGKGILTDLSPLQGMRLTRLHCTGNPVTDLSPLRGMPLTYLQCSNTSISDLSALKEMRLTVLYCFLTRVSDLSPLKGMPLNALFISKTKVSDLSPLQGMGLQSLNCNDTSVSDLSPLKSCQSLRSLDAARTKVTAAGVAELKKALPNCKIEWSGAAKPITNINDPAFQAWMKTVAASPTALKQVEAVAKKLVELNPGFDGKVTPTFQGRVVTGLEFLSDEVSDISPVRALKGLNTLNCMGSGRDGGRSKLSDLSPLNAMKLTSLYCNNTHVFDLSPLSGMPLTELWFPSTDISDLTPLQGMMTLTYLRCYNANISDLSPLAGMRLTKLECSGTKISDLSPLRGMKTLIDLFCDGTLVADLSPLEGMNLTSLQFTPQSITTGLDVIRQMKSLKTIASENDLDHRFPATEFWKKYEAGEFGKPATVAKPITNVNDPAFQAWMKDVQALPAEKQVEAVAKKLMELNPEFDGKLTRPSGAGAPRIESGMVTEIEIISDHVTDISPVRALVGLKVLACWSSRNTVKGMVSDLSPLKGLKLTQLRLNQDPVSDLSPLQGMPLTILECTGTQVSDLSALQGMSLTGLAVGGTKVTDLSPLAGMPLTYLRCYYNQQLSDLSPLANVQTLQTVEAQGTKVTAAGVAALQKALPNCKIEWDGSAKPKTPGPAASGTK